MKLAEHLEVRGFDSALLAAIALSHTPLARLRVCFEVHKAVGHELGAASDGRVEPRVVHLELEVGQLLGLVHGLDEDHAVAEDGALDEAHAAASWHQPRLLFLHTLTRAFTHCRPLSTHVCDQFVQL